MSFQHRCENAFLGLALGDAYGQPLEFLTGLAVHETPVPIDDGFRWTDDTHMALYLAEAALEAPHDDDAWGDAIGRAFVRWLDDPLMPSTAPGNTCLAGVRAWREHKDWRRSGVRRSDGCGAVMRIAPLPMCLSGVALDRAAHVQAVLTHGHPNASASAIAACRILRRVLETGVLRPEWVSRELDEGTDDLRAGLEAALRLAETPFDRLPLEQVPTHDGGWRSVSALALALACALRWTNDPVTAIDRAARHDGDSDSVACLAGMFVGATGARLPEDWLDVLPERQTITELSRRLSAGI